ncbi:MAG: carboxynorspermidine decarboxylase [Spirochaetae bacterium HGW-Spirochaetae-1]|jgi:carboxynorspermidine decarboxylase|nr:MAG: carboxynorspermidine decarboxylase [Spirochaetae bacterium HGW-Spirochaetae-1]
MERDFSVKLEMGLVPTPCFIVSREALEENLKIINGVQKATGCKILLALKGFSMFSVFPLVAAYLHGVCASSPHEARLGREEFRREVHSFAAAYSESDFHEFLELSDHIVFNSFSQYHHFKPLMMDNLDRVSFGLRVNPEHSEAPVPLYDPCAPRSRLGVRRSAFKSEDLEGISGLHFHTLCEQNADALERTVKAFEDKFGDLILSMKWVNFGGGHHITREDYDIDLLCRIIHDFKQKYNVDVYLEPGEAVALNTGVLVASVLDIINNDMDIAILDTSAAAHMPDVLEMPYRPSISGAGKPGDFPYTYRLGGISCLAGDIIGDYSFPEPLKPGDKIVFLDMAHYTMVKTNTFNGIQLPSIAIFSEADNELTIVKRFGYGDFRSRLS